VQGIRAERDAGNTSSRRRYLLAGLLRCGGICGRRLESCWANNRAAYRCRHGHTSATVSDPARPKNLYIREDRILPHLPSLHVLPAGTEPAAGRRRRRTRAGTDVPPPASDKDVIACLRAREITLTYDPRDRDPAGRHPRNRDHRHRPRKLAPRRPGACCLYAVQDVDLDDGGPDPAYR
jgi:site-specific DNA recombinase